MPDINGFDISLWNESGGLIDWPKVATDPRHFKFCWVKCGEGSIKPGEAGAYDYAIYSRQMMGAKSIRLETNPYHFWYYHLPWTINPDGSYNYLVLDPIKQAEAFASCAGDFEYNHPLVDIEDMYVGQFLTYKDTATANKAIAFARKVNANLKAYVYEVTRLMGTPVIYTGDWWMRKVTKLLIDNGYAAEIAWMQDFEWYLADYNEADGMAVPPGVDLGDVIAWQYTSTPTAPVAGIPNGDRVDLARWMKTQSDFDRWIGKDTNLTTANIHNTSVALGERAWIMEVKPDCKVTAGFKSLGVDALVLPMVNSVWDGSHQRVLPEPTFAGRFDEAAAAGIPVFGKVQIDASIVTIEQHTQLELDGHTVWQNLVVPKILDAWHIGPWTQGNLKPADFRPIKAIIFEQTTTQGFKGNDIGDFWQAHFHQYVVDKFRVLVEAGAIPDVPIIFKTTPTWLQHYPADFANMLQQPARKSWLYLALTDKRLTSTGSFADLWSIYQYATWNDYRYPYVPDGYAERVVLFEFTAGDQVMAFTSGNQKAYLSKWCDTAAALTEFIGGEPAEPPTPPPPDEITALKARVSVLEVKVMKLTGEISEPTLQAQLTALIENLHKV